MNKGKNIYPKNDGEGTDQIKAKMNKIKKTMASWKN